MLKNARLLQNISVIAFAVAGVIHLVLAPSHYAHAPAHGIFFALAGVAELSWAFAFWRRPNPRLYYIGLGLAGGLVVFWTMTRFLVPPFEHEPEIWDLGGLVCKASELAAILALCTLAVQGLIRGMPPASLARTAGMALALAVGVGIITYSVGLALEPVLPSLSGSGEHEHTTEGEASYEEAGPEGGDQAGALVHAGDLHIVQPWAGVAPMGSTAGVFMLILNYGQEADRLLSVETDVAEKVEIQETTIEADIAKMRPIEGGLEIPAGSQVELMAGGYHIMLINLLQALQPGDHIQLTLNFAKAGRVDVDAVVREP